MDTLVDDLRYAIRRLRRSPGFATLAAATLALGIGAATAIFTVLDHVVLRPLPYDEADRLAYVDSRVPGEGEAADWGVSEAGYFHLRDHNRSFEAVGAYGGAEAGHEFTFVGPDGGLRIRGGWVSASLLEVLGARPVMGRLIQEDDDGWMGPDGPGQPSVAVLGHDFWLRQFGGEPGVIGTTLELEGGLGVEVIGVVEAGFHLPHGPVDVWVPLGLHPARAPDSFHGYRMIVRLRPGVTIENAARDLADLTTRFPEVLPEVYSASFMRESGFETRVTPLRARVVGDLGTVLWIVLGSVSLLLLIACANVANLFLVRTEARRRDRAIREALGTSWVALLRANLAESAILGLAAAAIGIWIAKGAVQLLLAIAPATLPRLDEVSLGGSSVAVALVVGLTAGLVFGALPLFGRGSELAALRDGGASSTPSRGRQRVRSAMVVGQVAIALVLLTGAGLMVRSFQELRSVDPGLDPTNVLTVEIHPPLAGTRYARYLDPSVAQPFYRQLVERVAGLPGVVGVAVGRSPFTTAPVCLPVHVEDGPLTPAELPPCIGQTAVAPGFFRTLGIPLRGREPGWPATDGPTAPWEDGEVVVTPALAERLWPGEDPIGKGLRLRSPGPPYARVVGVTGDLYGDGLDRPPVEHLFVQLWRGGSTLVLHARSHPASLAGAVRAIVHEADPAVAVGDIRTMEEVITSSPAMVRTSFTLLLLGIGAMLGLVLSLVGLFGTLAYLVGQRRTEIGIRMAMGARGREVAAMIVRHSLGLTAVGVALGLAGAAAATRLLRALLFEVSPADPLVLAAVTVTLLLVAVVAAWVPARRAARVDPVVALREG